MGHAKELPLHRIVSKDSYIQNKYLKHSKQFWETYGRVLANDQIRMKWTKYKTDMLLL